MIDESDKLDDAVFKAMDAMREAAEAMEASLPGVEIEATFTIRRSEGQWLTFADTNMQPIPTSRH